MLMNWMMMFGKSMTYRGPGVVDVSTFWYPDFASSGDGNCGVDEFSIR
jgi:hypothetical protein